MKLMNFGNLIPILNTVISKNIALAIDEMD